MPMDIKSNTTINKVKKTPDKPTSTAGVKKIDFKVPSPKEPQAKKPLSTAHARTTSMGSLRGIATSSTGKPPPGRFAKPRSSLQKETQTESEIDDDASVAESFVSLSRVRRTEPERIAYFKNQPECSEIDPHRVWCTRCQKHVSLGKKQTYAVRPWEKHREKCDQKVPKSMFDKEAESGAVKESPLNLKTEEERKATLEADPRAEKIEKEQVLCRRCQKWVKSNSTLTYSLYNWKRHQQTCSDSQQIKGHTPRHIECKQCGKNVQLVGSEYNLENWETHKLACVPPAASSVSGSTDITLVPPPDTESPVRGKKRALEEEEDDDDEGVPPTNRPRNEAYEEPTQEPPSAIGWFLRPVREFVRGFTEGLR
ncbi:hypothetical protein CPB85DRAFT_365792 [Mucidula mucida]|nr:hypothetical protein CPB85DRAFT_365792 [Mucidula mucida]